MSFRRDKGPKTLNEAGNTGKESLSYKLKSSRSFIFLSALILLVFMIAALIGEKLAPQPVIEKRPVMRVLFIGNSLTFHNDMPAIFGNLALYDPSSKFYIKAGTFIKGGASLREMWNHPLRKDALTKEKWDYVVIQPKPFWALTDMWFKENDRYIEIWVNAIRNIGAKPVFFMTQPLHTKSGFYKTPGFPFLSSPMQVYENTARRTEYVTKKYDLITVPIGDYWFYVTLNNLDLRLHERDGVHPSIYGASLNALLFYKTLVDNTLGDIRYKPDGVKANRYNEILSLAIQDL